jgi:propionyl-CoA synthetase
MGSLVDQAADCRRACLPTLWQNGNERFRKEAYLSEFPGYYTTSDAGYQATRTATCSSWARTDDMINVAGHRLSTGRHGGGAWRSHPDVAECAVLGVEDDT